MLDSEGSLDVRSYLFDEPEQFLVGNNAPRGLQDPLKGMRLQFTRRHVLISSAYSSTFIYFILTQGSFTYYISQEGGG